eukprot:g12184.t1
MYRFEALGVGRAFERTPQKSLKDLLLKQLSATSRGKAQRGRYQICLVLGVNTKKPLARPIPDWSGERGPAITPLGKLTRTTHARRSAQAAAAHITMGNVQVRSWTWRLPKYEASTDSMSHATCKKCGRNFALNRTLQEHVKDCDGEQKPFDYDFLKNSV